MAEIKTDYIEKCLSSLELANQHLLILPEFINDVKNFVKAVQKQNDSKT